jgi:hypothetical protein
VLAVQAMQVPQAMHGNTSSDEVAHVRGGTNIFMPEEA